MNNNKKICSKCGLSFEESEINDHDMRCGYAFNSSDYSNLIPCEFCNEFISFEDYDSHSRRCFTSRQLRFDFMNINNSPRMSQRISQDNNQPDNQSNTDDQNNLESETINNINTQINNDPIARTFFNILVGGLPLQSTNEHTTENTTEDITEDTTEITSEYNRDNITNNLNNIIQNQDSEIGQDTLVEDNSEIGQNIESQILNNQNIINLDNFTNNELLSTMFSNLMSSNNIFEETELLPNFSLNYEQLINLNDVEIGVDNIDNVSQLLFIECECPICCQTSLLSRKTKCNHIFCDSCLTEWLKNNKKCPTCMIELE